MAEDGVGTAFPVVLFDGEREMNIGNVRISPAMEYKQFQLMLSQKIGISPNQFSIYLIERKNNSNSNPQSPFTEEWRRIPITGKVNFAYICSQQKCCFLAVLRRSRKSRNRKERMINGVYSADFLPETVFTPPPVRPVPANLILLRRSQETPSYDRITPSEVALLNDRLQSLKIGKESYYQTAMAEEKVNFMNFGYGHEKASDLSIDSFPTIDESYCLKANSARMMMMMTTKSEGEKAFFCEECWNAKKNGGTASFHHCVNDTVITRFKTRAGPIKRPVNLLH
ncbi:hypothetical protein BUALT_Bualt11G0089600 [Buddleja alternifolia]|uniref:DUF7138 domain-containing protein n=1 Tax=Buddleja alternifolia TaxID=168488 RepID=A0AAV6X4G1_9LAMI|nr:hypothetical protein BUALT_Bualt11G0089600 [Buddleja alternifolia]